MLICFEFPQTDADDHSSLVRKLLKSKKFRYDQSDQNGEDLADLTEDMVGNGYLPNGNNCHEPCNIGTGTDQRLYYNSIGEERLLGKKRIRNNFVGPLEGCYNQMDCTRKLHEFISTALKMEQNGKKR
ncbi:unnamed protein product [Gordionus sp. m RMFG-2023]